MTTERYVRLCPEHRHELTDGGQDARGAEIVRCPRGHRLRAWVVCDREKHVDLAECEQDPRADRRRCIGWPLTNCNRIVRARGNGKLCGRCAYSKRRSMAILAQAEARA